MGQSKVPSLSYSRTPRGGYANERLAKRALEGRVRGDVAIGAVVAHVGEVLSLSLSLNDSAPSVDSGSGDRG